MNIGKEFYVGLCTYNYWKGEELMKMRKATFEALIGTSFFAVCLAILGINFFSWVSFVLIFFLLAFAIIKIKEKHNSRRRR